MGKDICFLLITLLFALWKTEAQTIALHFPYFPDQEYSWTLFQGDKIDTLAVGSTDSIGKCSLVMPEQYRDYRGMTRWLLKNGGGLDMICAGYDFSVESLSEQPNEDNIIYTGNPENDYLLKQSSKQHTTLDKIQAAGNFLKVFSADDAIYLPVGETFNRLKQDFENLQSSRSKNPLYAARFMEIVDLTLGVADRYYEDPMASTVYLKDFVTYKLDLDDLYTSGHWDQVLTYWIIAHINAWDPDSVFSANLMTLMRRTSNDTILAAFCRKAIPIFAEKGKDEMFGPISSYLSKHNWALAMLPANDRDLLLTYKPLKGKQASDLVFHAPLMTQLNGKIKKDTVIRISELGAPFTVLLFYEGDCNSCEDALIGLNNAYNHHLREKGVRMISISASTDEKSFTEKFNYCIWNENFCDFQGMEGNNFKNYAVLGIPTLFLLDSKGIILDKTASVDLLMKWFDE